MGLYKQPNDYSCGPFALKHALVTLGRLTDEDAITKVAAPHWWAGTDEVKLARAARHFECELPLIRHHSEDEARLALVRTLSKNHPTILCVDDWGHSITVVRHQQSRFVAIDSKEEPVLQVMSWQQLRKRWRYTGYDEPIYDFHRLEPLFRVPVKAQFSVERAQFLRRSENADLALYWDHYLEDLMEICRPRHRSTISLSVTEFLRRRQDMLLSRLGYWHGHLEVEKARRVLRNFCFVAETYGLVIPASEERRAMVDMAVLLGMWAAASHGVGSMYGYDVDAEEYCGRGRQVQRTTRVRRRARR